MRFKTMLISLALALLMMIFVVGYATNEISKPTAYSTSTTVTVNISGGVNASGISGLTENATVNVTILNKSSSAGAYGRYFVDAGIDGHKINSSGDITDYFWNYTVTLNDNERHWIRLNFTNATAGGSLSSVRIIDIDTRYYVLDIEVQLNADSLRLGNVSNLYNDEDCDGSTYGTIIYNASTPGYFFGCTPDGWVNLTSQNS